MKYQVLSLITILRPADGSDCTMSGLSMKHTNATLLVPEGMQGLHGPIELLGKPIDISNMELRGAIFELVSRNIMGNKYPYFHAKPFGEKRWCMFGGNYLSYSGNGFSTICEYPVPIHDRIE